MDLLEIRGRLDQIDTQIEKLFEERMRLCSEVAEYKIATGKAVYDAEREKQKIESVQAMAEGLIYNGHTALPDDLQYLIPVIQKFANIFSGIRHRFSPIWAFTS